MSFDRLEVGGVELLVEASIPHRSVWNRWSTSKRCVSS